MATVDRVLAGWAYLLEAVMEGHENDDQHVALRLYGLGYVQLNRKQRRHVAHAQRRGVHDD